MRNDLADSRNIIKFALPQRRIRLTLPAYLCLKTALRRSEIREYYTLTRKGLVEVENYYWSLKRK